MFAARPFVFVSKVSRKLGYSKEEIQGSAGILCCFCDLLGLLERSKGVLWRGIDGKEL
jgi:hypothetical protein